MRFSIVLIACLSAAICAGVPCAAQTKLPPETRNAALRYWLAMADLHDPPADQATQELLEKTENGSAPWDESKLGPILDANMVAVQEMQRASKLPDCDWGLEYSRGARASVAHLMRARVLARLNTLYGMRLMAKGQSQPAVEAWLDSVKFSQDVGNGGPIIFQLIGHTLLVSNYRAMTQAANAGKLSETEKAEIARAVHAKSVDVFDWSAAYRLEEASGEMFVNEVRTAKDPASAYQAVMGQPMPAGFKPPSEAEMTAYRELTARAEAALRTPPADAQGSLEKLQSEIEHSQDIPAITVPSLVKINEARARVVAAREALLKSVGG
jgi:hypothetical protein